MKSKKPTKAVPAKTAKSTKKAEPKVKLAVKETGKGSKKSAKIEVKAVEAAAAPASEEEDEDEMTTAGQGGGANNAGLAAAAATADTTAGSLKNFRHHPDIENFYRFIFENDLRYEALEIIDVMASQRATKKAVKSARSRPN